MFETESNNNSLGRCTLLISCKAIAIYTIGWHGSGVKGLIASKKWIGNRVSTLTPQSATESQNFCGILSFHKLTALISESVGLNVMQSYHKPFCDARAIQLSLGKSWHRFRVADLLSECKSSVFQPKHPGDKGTEIGWFIDVIMLNYLSRARSPYVVVDQQQLYSSWLAKIYKLDYCCVCQQRTINFIAA